MYYNSLVSGSDKCTHEGTLKRDNFYKNHLGIGTGALVILENINYR